LTEAELAWALENFDRCKDWIQAGLDRDAMGLYDLDGVRAMVERGDAQIWPTENGCMITTIETYPKAKVLRGWLAGGNLEEIQKSEPNIAKWAKHQGCDLVMISGRRGWLKAFSGYSESCTSLFKRL
jgi:hypothetical protein